jgi:hypothetical protein
MERRDRPESTVNNFYGGQTTNLAISSYNLTNGSSGAPTHKLFHQSKRCFHGGQFIQRFRETQCTTIQRVVTQVVCK